MTGSIGQMPPQPRGGRVRYARARLSGTYLVWGSPMDQTITLRD